MELLNDLNDSQRQAVEYIDGPSLVIAGAGSGKTRVLTYKIAYLMEQGLEPWSILALTFTNKAAREMKDRIGRLVGAQRASYLQMGTFHSIFSRILRVEAQHVGYNSNYTIYDETDSRNLIKTIIKEMQLDDKQYKPASVHSAISMAKNNLMSAQDYQNSTTIYEQNLRRRVPDIGKVFVAYNDRLHAANAMDFDDLLVLTYRLFHDCEDIRQKYAQRFRYVLVDEYQDTNYAQQCIVLQLTREHQHVCVVGDDAQSIYSFRGAKIDNILGFQKLYQGCRLFKLERNYRSTQNIVLAANSLIKHNSMQIPKDTFSRNAEGQKLVLMKVASDREESAMVVRTIRRLRKEEKCGYSDFAILYRTNSQSRSFEEELRKQNMPYRIYGGMSFYQRKEIKDILAYFRLVANPDDEEAIKRIINYPARGIGNTTLNKVSEAARQSGASFWQVISSLGNNSSLGGNVLDVNRATATKLLCFRNLIASFQAQLATTDAYTLGKDIIQKSGISQDLYSTTDADAVARQENMEEFLSGLQTFVEDRMEQGMEHEVMLTDFLQEVSLLTDLDSDNGNDNDRVTLMTVHAAKGLEFATVFVVGLEENIFPSPMCTDSLRGIEEERRLLYVAITRAERHCFLSCAKNRWRFGQMVFDTPSRFISEISPEYMDVEDEFSRMSAGYGDKPSAYDDVPFGRSRREPSSYDIFNNTNAHRHNSYGSSVSSSSATNRRLRPVTPQPSVSATTDYSEEYHLGVGNVIEHQRFGIGKVVKLEGKGENTKATVEFRNSGQKQLLLKFAKFTIVQ